MPMTLYHPRPERWPQVSLRGFFMLVTVLGILCWVAVQVSWIRSRHRVLNTLTEQHLKGIKDVEMVVGHKIDFACSPIEGNGTAPWCLRVFGEPGIRAFSFTDAELP